MRTDRIVLRPAAGGSCDSATVTAAGAPATEVSALMATCGEKVIAWAAGALALLLVYWSTYRTRVPLFLSGPQTWRALEELLPAAASGHAPRFIDLGCGVGGLILHLARARPDVTVHGIELAPLPALVSRLRIELARLPNASASWGSFWDRDLSGYDVVFAFLSPVPMPRLWAQLRAQMRTGTLFVSSSFPVPGITPERCIEVEDRKRATLYLYRL